MRALADDRCIAIKKADKGSTVVVWDHREYKLVMQMFSDADVYMDVSFNEKILQELVGTSNQLFQNLKSKGKISDKQLKYFTYGYKKFLTYRGTPTEKASESLDYHLKPIMQRGKSYL